MNKFSLSGVLIVSLVLTAGPASANLLTNGSFQSGDFTGWTTGVTSNGAAGTGFPVVTGWPLGGSNAAKYEVGDAVFDGTFQGATLSQSFNTAGGSVTLSFDYAAMGDGIHTNADGGDFALILDGTTLTSTNLGTITANQTISGSLSDTLSVSAGLHTFEIEILRPFASVEANTPYQYVTAADVEGAAGAVPEPGTLALMGAALLGLGCWRKGRR